MKTARIIALLALLLFLMLIAGCTARSQILCRQPLETGLRHYSTLVFSAESDVTDDVTMEMADLEEQVLASVKSRRLFQNTQLGESEESPESTLFVKASISNTKKVGGTTRFFLGAFAGRASMTADVVFIDAETGRALGSYTVIGESGGSGYSGGTNDAVKKTAECIADLICRNH